MFCSYRQGNQTGRQQGPKLVSFLFNIIEFTCWGSSRYSTGSRKCTSCLLILTGYMHLTKSKEMPGSEWILWIYKDTQNSFCDLRMHTWNLPKRSTHRNTMVIAEAVPSNIRSPLQSPVVLVSNNTTTIFIHIFINDNFSPHLNIFHCLY